MTVIQTPEAGTELETQTPQTEVEETTENPSEETEAPQEPTPEQPSPEPAPPEGYVPKEKFVASAQESILNAARVEARDAQLEKLTKSDTPTDEAMRLLYSNWDELDDTSKTFYVKQEAQEMRQRRIEAQQDDILSRQKLEDELEAVITSESKLAGREAEFKRFARNPKNKGINAETLAKAFLFDVEEPAPQAAPPSEGLPTGSGGPRGDMTPKKMSVEDAAKIRVTDYKRYLELVKTGQIEDLE